MCGRFFVNASDPEIEPFLRPDQWVLPGLNDSDNPDLPPGATLESILSTGEIYPDNSVPVLTLHQGHIHPRLMGWGFPKWDGKGVQFNARSETAHELKSFKESLARWRVAVPTSGFYEWREEEGEPKKVKYLFTDPEHPVLYIAAIAGIFARAKSPIKDRFTILTRDSTGTSVKPYHSRTPVILRQEDLVPWMAGPDYTQFFTRQQIPLIATRTD